LACQSFAGIIVQPALGRWIDESHHTRPIVAVSALGIAIIPSYAFQIVVQLIIGVAITAFPAAIAAFALGLVDRTEISSRVDRAESFAYSGNFVFAAVGSFYALLGIFYALRPSPPVWPLQRSSSDVTT
jgi:hypothetical protein